MQYLMQPQQSRLTLRSCCLRVQSMASHVASETLVHILRHSWCEVRELELHLYMYVVHDLLVHRHDERVVHVSVHRRCTFAVHVSVHRRCTYVVHELELHHDASGLALHHRGERVAHVRELHLYMNVVDDLMVHRHDERVVRA